MTTHILIIKRSAFRRAPRVGMNDCAVIPTQSYSNRWCAAERTLDLNQSMQMQEFRVW